MKTQCKKILTKINEDYVESRVYYTMYTLVFVVMCVSVFWYFIRTGKSFVEVSDGTAYDGLTQHYTFFSYYGRYLREIVFNVLRSHSLSIPTFDFNIGFGEDIVTTLSYYVMGDPFSFLAIFAPMKYAEYLYNALILLRIFLAGVSFSAYCRYHGQRSLYTLGGALIYVFSGTTLYSAVYHPYFMNPLIWMPLIFIAVDKILCKKNGGARQYVGILAIMGLSNFYFFYMSCLLIVIYTIFRYIMLHEQLKGKEVLAEMGKFIAYSIVGLGMSCVLFLPAMSNIMSSSRISGNTKVPLLYEPYYYIKFVGNFMSSTMGVHYERMGYTALALFAVSLLIIRSYGKPMNKTYKYLRNAFCMLVIFMCIPFFGSLFNGTGYPTNRFVFALTFLVSLIVTIMLPALFDAKLTEMRKLFVIGGVLTVFVLSISIIRTNKNMMALLCIWAVLAVILAKKTQLLDMGKKLISIFMVGILLFLNAFFTYCPMEENFVKNYLNKGDAFYEITDKSPAMVVPDEKNASRFDTEGASAYYRNAAIIAKKMGTSLYYSTCSKSVSDITNEMCLNNPLDFSNNNLQHRTYLDALMGVQYFVIKQGDNGKLPYGYDHLVKREKGYEVYTSRYTTGMAFTSDQWIDESTYEKMSVVQKQQALLQGVVTENDNGLAHAELSFGDRECKYQIKNIKGLNIEGDTIRVTDPGAELELSFEGTGQSECYVVFDNLQYEGTRKADNYTKQQIAKLSYEEQGDINNSKLYAAPSSAVVSASADQAKCALTVYGKTNQFYSGKSNFLLNMGYSDTAKNKIKLTFQQRGIFTFDKLSVVCQPMSDYERDMEQRQKHVVEDIKLGTNCLDASVEAEKDSMLVLVLPIKSGWKATVNGKETEIQHADGSFMAVKVTAGTNKVHLQYSNPYFVAGGVISIICWSGYLVAFVYDRRKKHKKVKGNTNE